MTSTLDAGSDYELIKSLDEGVEIVACKRDGEKSVAHTIFKEDDSSPTNTLKKTLFARGAGEAVANLLNHENLVSITGLSATNTLVGIGGEHRLLWDYCDAGTLEQLLQQPPVPVQPDGAGFLPEGLVWHVAISMLRALQWLHEGIRDTYDTEQPTRGASKKSKIRGATAPDKDWMPVMHRAVAPGNIFFQLPQGIETYGTCKLGNLSHSYISGLSGLPGYPVTAPHEHEPDVPVEELRWRFTRWELNKLNMGPKETRPLTLGCDLHDLGKVLFRMMTGKEHPSIEECDTCDCYHFDHENRMGPACPHQECSAWRSEGNWEPGHQLDAQTMYTDELKGLVYDLIGQWRELTRGGDLLGKHWPGYLNWIYETQQGQQHKDIFDDIEWRQANSNMKQMGELQALRETLGIDIEGRIG